MPPRFRVFEYLGHHVQIEETRIADATSWILYVDRRRVAGRDTERAASDLAYATIDRMVADAELRPRLVELSASKNDVRGSAFDPETHEVGQPVWIQWRGSWRRGVVCDRRGAKVEVALLVEPTSRKVRRAWGKAADTVIARFAEG